MSTNRTSLFFNNNNNNCLAVKSENLYYRIRNIDFRMCVCAKIFCTYEKKEKGEQSERS